MNFSKASLERLDYLAARWADEKEFEAFGEYVTEMKKLATAEKVKFTTASRRPFGFTFDKDGRSYRVAVTAKHIKITESLPDFGVEVPDHLLNLEVPMVSLKKNAAATKPTPAKKPVRPVVAKKPDPNDLTPPAFLDAKKKFTPEQIAEQKARADRDDKATSTITMPERKPEPPKAPKAPKVEKPKKPKYVQPAGTKSPKQVAADLKTDPRHLRRALRTLAKQGKMEHDMNGRWAITAKDVATIKAYLETAAVASAK